MNKLYTHQTSKERDIIVVIRTQEKGLSETARILWQNKSIICRELKRSKLLSPKGKGFPS